MKKNEKKLSKLEKDNLKFMVEDFLERDKKALLKYLKDSSDKGLEYFSKLNLILSKGFHFPGDPDDEDMVDGNFEKLVIGLHTMLNPVWDGIKKALLNFQDEIQPGREKNRKLKSDIISGKIDEKAPWYKYLKLGLQDSAADEEKYYEINFKHYISFESGSINFHSAPNQVLLNFLDLFRDVPISYFSRCAFSECGKIIILTRANKSYCKNCAARKGQFEKRKKDPVGAKAKDKERYLTKRKKSLQWRPSSCSKASV
jgi:hypothetical protein